VKKKNIALIAAGVLGVGTCTAVQIDRQYNILYATNTAYCTIRNALFGTDGISKVDIALYYDSSMTRNEMRKARNAFENVKDEYQEEFGIDLQIASENRAWDGRKEFDNIADLSMIFVPEIPDDDTTDTETTKGLAFRRDSFMLIEYSSHMECLESALQHELGHIFYAEHSDNPLCVMFHHNICFRQDIWCDEEKEIITRYKHRIW